MTISVERRDLLNRTKERRTLQPGEALLFQPGSLINPEVHIHALSDDVIEVRTERLGQRAGELEVATQILEGNRINRSRRTFSYLGGIKVLWRPTPEKPQV